MQSSTFKAWCGRVPAKDRASSANSLCPSTVVDLYIFLQNIHILTPIALLHKRHTRFALKYKSKSQWYPIKDEAEGRPCRRLDPSLLALEQQATTQIKI